MKTVDLLQWVEWAGCLAAALPRGIQESLSNGSNWPRKLRAIKTSYYSDTIIISHHYGETQQRPSSRLAFWPL